MNIVIIEDEKPAARLLIRELDKLGFSVQQTLHSVSEAIPWFVQNEQPDLIFADIQLTDGLSLEIFEQVELQHSAIIFVTSFDHYAIKAFKLNSIDYLLKPIDSSELLGAITKFKAHCHRIGQQVEQLRRTIPKATYPKRFMVKIGMQLKMILVEDVVCFYREDRGVYVVTKEGKSHLLDESSLEAIVKMVDPSQFFRVNRYQIIAIDFIEQMIHLSASRLKVTLLNYKEEVMVSRERISDFKLWLGAN